MVYFLRIRSGRRYLMKNFVVPSMDVPNEEGLSNYMFESVRAFASLTGIPVTFFSDSGEIIREFASENKICNIFASYRDLLSPCRKALLSAGRFSSGLGEPYLFSCKSGLMNIAVSLIVDNTFKGYFIAGPLVMGELRSSITNNFLKLNDLSEAEFALAAMFASKLNSYQPGEISDLVLLLYNSILSSTKEIGTYNALRNQNMEQNEINLEIQYHKKEHFEIEYPHDTEKKLIQSIKSGQGNKAKEALHELLDQIFILEAGNMDVIKTRVLWLFAIIVRMAGEEKSMIREIVDIDLDIINKISEAETTKDIYRTATDLIELIAENMLSAVYSGSSPIIIAALQYINRNYMHKVSLSDIERELHVNSSYFSTLFKTEMGVSFTEYLNSLRIDKACSLLSRTNMSLVDISMSVGFEDQSYFTKVFKKRKMITPKGYRYKQMSSIGIE